MKALKILTVLAIALGTLPAKADPAPNRPYFFTGRCDPKRILESTKMDRALRLISQKANMKLNLFSCYRSQSRQNGLLASRGCLKKGGCASTASRSQHTYGVAADFSLNRGVWESCQLMDSVRKELLGGRGGIGSYSSGSVHFDVRDRPSSWVGCKGIGNNITGTSKVVDNFLAADDPFKNTWDQQAMKAGEQRRLEAEAKSFGYNASEEEEGHDCTDVVCGLFRFLFGG